MDPIRHISPNEPVNHAVEPVRPAQLSRVEREEARQRREQARRRVLKRRREKAAQDRSSGADHFG